MRHVEARLVTPHDLEAVQNHLALDARANLLLIELVARLGQAPAPGEMRSQVAVATLAGEICGVVSLRPTVVFDAAVDTEALEALLPFFEPLGVGLVKSEERIVDALWERLSRGGRRRAVVDRIETAYALVADSGRLTTAGEGEIVRPASVEDLEPLVHAARESLREESRPDPFAGDMRGFRRWVRGRVARARVVERNGRVVFVGYADVKRPEGWLLQGIYTWPESRRQGFAATGTSVLCQEAFESQARHVQLAVVDGNDAARGLYEGLGFKPFGRLRTILFG
ncbi:MAG: GNAT family N-acetyltransferase [Planctomycetota bacterium]|nr:GNAT family N-acetyltransferase [Planctomycetota bacterium]